MALRTSQRFGHILLLSKYLRCACSTYKCPFSSSSQTSSINTHNSDNFKETVIGEKTSTVLLSQRDQNILGEFLKFDAKLGEKLKTVDLVVLPTKSDSFADYVGSSKTLQTLVMFGVELYKIEKQFPDSLEFLVKLDINRNVVPRLEFLKKNGLTPKEFGQAITKNPYILNPKYRIEDFEET